MVVIKVAEDMDLAAVEVTVVVEEVAMAVAPVVVMGQEVVATEVSISNSQKNLYFLFRFQLLKII